MAAPTFVAAGAIATDTSGSASTTPTPPAHLADDILIAVGVNAAGSSMSTATSGWTKVGEQIPGGTTAIAWWWKRATGAGTAGPTITASGTDQFSIVYVIRGCRTSGDPYEHHIITTDSSASPLAGGGTSSGADRLHAVFHGHTDDTAFSSGHPPSGWTDNSRLTTATGTQAGFTVISKVRATSGTELNPTVGTWPAAEISGLCTFVFVPNTTGLTMTAATGSFSMSGQTAVLKVDRKLTAAQTSFTFSGQNAVLAKGQRLTADVGSFSLSGQLAQFIRTYQIATALGSFTFSGQTATLRFDRRLTADTANFSMAGQNVTFDIGKVLSAAQASFSLSGQNTALRFDRKLTAASAAFTLSGQTGNLLLGRKLTAASGSFSLSGQNANLTFAKIMSALTGSFALTGNDAIFSKSIILVTEVGTFAFNGQAATLIYGGFINQPLPYPLKALILNSSGSAMLGVITDDGTLHSTTQDLGDLEVLITDTGITKTEVIFE